MKKYKIILIIVVLGIIGVAGYFLGDSKFAYGGYERSMVEFAAGSFSAVQESYKTEYKSYSTDSNEIKKLLSFTEEVTGYVDINEVPVEFKNKVGPEDKPYLNEKSYKILLLIRSKKYNQTSVWTFDNAEAVKKISP